MSGSRITVGNVQIVHLLDAPFEVPFNVFFPDVVSKEFEAYKPLYPDARGNVGLRINVTCYAIRSQGRTILCDTGIGPGPVQALGGIQGALIEDMNTKGVPPESVDLVIHTHLHVDHVGWNVSPDNVPYFPKAKHYVSQEDWDFFSKALDANPHVKSQVVPLRGLGRLETFSGEFAVTPEVTTYPTPGHTPGHTSLLVTSAGERAIITGDLAHHPAQVDHPEWKLAFDTDHEKAAESRSRILDQLEADGLVAAFCHFPAPGFGRIVRSNGRRIFQAM